MKPAGWQPPGTTADGVQDFSAVGGLSIVPSEGTGSGSVTIDALALGAGSTPATTPGDHPRRDHAGGNDLPAAHRDHYDSAPGRSCSDHRRCGERARGRDGRQRDDHPALHRSQRLILGAPSSPPSKRTRRFR